MTTAKSLSQSQTRPVQAFGWTVPELFGLHPVPEQSAPNYDRLARLDDLGLLWLLRDRPVIAVMSTEAIIRCHSGATLKFYRRTKPALAAIGNVMQIVDAGDGRDQRGGDTMSGAHSRRKGARVELAIAKLIGARKVLVIKADRREPLIVMPLSLATQIANKVTPPAEVTADPTGRS
jgi:hypothetical protein